MPSAGRTANELCIEYGFDSVQAMRDDIPEGAVILDVGAGRSNLLEALTYDRPDITAVAADVGYGAVPDPSSLVQNLMELHTLRPTEHVRLVGASALHLPFPDATFQRVYSYYLLPWLFGTNYDAAISEMVRVADREIGKVMYGPNLEASGTNGSIILSAHDTSE